MVRKYNKLGDYSYGIYIYAFPTQQTMMHFIPDASVATLATLAGLITIVLAVFSWHFVEKHALKEKSRIVTRIIEFCLFGFLNWWIIRITVIFFSHTPTALFFAVIGMLWIMFWINVSLLVIVFIRLLITKKFSAYITLFFLLTLFYALYILFDYLYGAFFSTESADPIYIITSFIVDFFLFLYILGVVYSRVDFIQNKLKFLKVDTVALFLVIMKIYVQVSKIVPKLVDEEMLILQAGGLFVIFAFFNLLFGIHSIFAHKHDKKKKTES